MRAWSKGLESAAGIAICVLAAATPWLFGTTESWSVNLMNAASLAAGAIALLSVLLRRLSREQPAGPPPGPERIWRRVFLGLNLLLLAFCAVAWLNARATFSLEDETFAYRENISWLPASYDAVLTREALVGYLACFSAFWTCRHWLARGWERALQARGDSAWLTVAANRRFRAILWVLSANATFLAIEGLLQRLSRTPKLLWLRTSFYANPDSCFGPFAYRGNAAEYLNLIWPVALGFWWLLARERRRSQSSARLMTDGPELMLIPGVIIMAAATVVTLSRGGALIAGALLLACLAVLLAQKGVSKRARAAAVAMVAAVLGLVTFIGWESLVVRFKFEDVGEMSGRPEIYRNAAQIAGDFPVFGAGPGAFRSVYHLYREDTRQLWHGFLHDDWLETIVTFGWTGFALILAQFVVLALWVLARGKAPASGGFMFCCGLAFAGLLVHAKFDFPFQTYSIVYTFVVLAAILTTVSPERE